MLHGDFFNRQAGRLAERVVAEVGPDPRAQVGHAIYLALGRVAADDEIAEGLDLVHRLTKEHNQISTEALRYWCLTVLNLNEFVYVD